MLDERRSYLERRQADLTIAEGDLERRMRQLDQLRREISGKNEDLQRQMADWARLRVAEAQKVQVLDEVERARMAEQAEVFAQMKDAAWQHLRTFNASEIARYLALMEPKVASRVLRQAVADEEYPALAHDITKRWLTLDMEGITGDQVNRLAELYSLMAPNEVAQYLSRGRLSDVAAIYAQLSTLNKKKAAQVLQALRVSDPDLEQQLLRYIDESASLTQAGASMIMLTRLNGEEFALNSAHIECIEQCPDTRIELINGKQIYVQQSPDEVRIAMKAWLRSIHHSEEV